MKIGKKKYRLKKSVRRAIYSCLGIAMGFVCAINTNAIAAETNVTVDADRISIDDYEFFKQRSVVQVTLPDSIQQIGFSAFEGCSELSNINLVDSLNVIDNRAFAKCTSLTQIKIPQKTVFIGNAAFYGCESLDNVEIPDGIRELSNNLFYGCSSLSNITLPKGLSTIGQQCFYNCTGLSQIELPDSLSKIDEGAFYDCSNLGMLHIPDSVTEIGTDAFRGCDNLMIIANHGSYAEQYALANGIKYRNSEIEQDIITTAANTTQKVLVPDVPATGVDTLYMQMFALMILSALGLIVLNRKRLA